jgi:hypothetical protein
MSKTISFEVPDAIYSALEQLAVEKGKAPSEVAAEWVISITPQQRPPLSAEELAAARDRMRQHFGVFSSGDPHFADNDRIDEDLAKEYGRGLDD